MMKNAKKSPSIEGKNEKDLMRRRVFLFFAITFVALSLATMWDEVANLYYFIDELGLLIGSLVIIVIFAAMWKKNSGKDLEKQLDAALFITTVMIVLKMYGYIIELHNPIAVGDEIPFLIGVIIMLFSRFI